MVLVGTPEFAVPVLRALAASHHHLAGVVTAPRRPVGRGLRPRASPVWREATGMGLPVAEIEPSPPRLLADHLRSLGPDVVAVAAWGGLLSRDALGQGRVASLNVHASLLPRWRGAAPVERAIIAGDQVTGISIMYMSPELDAGDILLQASEPIGEHDTGGEVSARLAELGGRCLVGAIDLLAGGQAPRRPQPSLGVTWAPKLSPGDERITWLMPAPSAARVVRALLPVPGAYFTHQGRRVKVLAARAGPAQPGAGEDPGTVVAQDGKAGTVTVAMAGGGALCLARLRPAGAGEMTAAAYLAGRRMTLGDRFDQ